MAFDTSQLGLQGDMPWDLRTVYANFIVAPCLVEIADARRLRNFQKYWQELHNLYVVVHHKIQDKEGKEKGESFDSLRKKALMVINKHSGAFIGNDHNSEAVQEVLNVLEVMEMFLYDKMDEAKLFGGKKTQDSFM